MISKGLYTVIQWTWGICQTAAGAVLFLVHRKDRHYSYRGATVTLWKNDGCVSLGKFLFVTDPTCRKGTDDPDDPFDDLPFVRLLVHEYGHSIQSLILGPFYFLVIGLPSIVWHRAPHFEKYRMTRGISYYSPYFERTADKLGESAARGSKTD